MTGRAYAKCQTFAVYILIFARYFSIGRTRGCDKKNYKIFLAIRQCTYATMLALFANVMICSIGVSAQGRFSDILRENNPFSCAKASDDYTGTSACIGDAGGYQLARLALSIEAFSSALSSAGIKDSNTSIQSEIYADMGKFGLEYSLIAPAMALADISSMKNSPFGSVSQLVAGKSLIALEYLVPGTIHASGLDYRDVASMAKMRPMHGPSDFSEYMHNLSNTSNSLDEFRIYSAPEDSISILRKLQISKPSSPEQARNYAADFYFPNKLSINNDRGVPFALVFSEMAAQQQSTNGKMDTKFFETLSSPSGAEYIGDTPFGGAACKSCKNINESTARNGTARPLQRGGMLIQEVSATLSTPSVSYKVISDGLDIMASGREGSRAMITSGSGLNSTVLKHIGQDDDEAKAKPYQCAVSCAAKETATFILEAYSGVKGVGNTFDEGDPYKTRAAIDRGLAKLHETITGEHYRPCVKKCVSDNAISTSTGGPPSGSTPRDGTPRGGTQTSGTDSRNANGNEFGEFRPGPSDDEQQRSGNAGAIPSRSPGPARPATNCMPPSTPGCLCDLSSRGTLKQCRHVDASDGSGLGYGSPWAIKNTQSPIDRLIYIAVSSGAETGRTSREVINNHDLAIFRSNAGVVLKTDSSSLNLNVHSVPPSIDGNNFPGIEDRIPDYPNPAIFPPVDNTPAPEVLDIYPPHTGYR